MRRLRRSLLGIALLSPLVLAAACHQGVGDHCKQPADCEDGLVCAIPAGAASGSCQAPGALDGSDDGGAGDR